jgi:hypothetical protein
MAGRLPQSDDRIAILGKTGSGKTVAGLWHLSKQDIDARPWVVIDFKGDVNINAIEKAQYITYDTSFKKMKPGLYILRSMPDDTEELNDWFLRVWDHENMGVMVDEGFMLESKGALAKGFNMCLIQGRSKHITMVILSQRPVWMSRYVLSEASFIQMFSLNDSDDTKGVKRFVADRGNVSVMNKPSRFHSYYYDVSEDELLVLGPVPKVDVILDAIDAKLPNIRPTL